MDKRNRNQRKREIQEIWESYEFILRDDLQRLDYRTRAMIAEMTTMGCTREMIAEFVPQAFNELWNDVAQEGIKKYDTRVRTA